MLSATTFYLENGEMINGKIISSKDGLVYIESGDKLVIVSSFLIENAFSYGEDVLAERMEQFKNAEVDRTKYSEIREFVQEQINPKHPEIAPKTKPEISSKAEKAENKQPIPKEQSSQDTIKTANQIREESPVFIPQEESESYSNLLTDMVIVLKNGRYLNGNIISYDRENLVIKNDDNIKVPIRSGNIAHIFPHNYDIFNSLQPFGLSYSNVDQIYEDFVTSSRLAGKKLAKKNRSYITPFAVGALGGIIPVLGPITFTLVAAMIPVETPHDIPSIYSEYEFINSYKASRIADRAIATLAGSVLVNVIIFVNLN